MDAPTPCSTLLQSRLLVAVSLALAASSLRAQPPQARPPSSIEFAVEQNVRDRWMYGRQQARFTRFNEMPHSWLLIDSLRSADGGERRLYLTLGRTPDGRDSAVVVFAADGRVSRLDASLRPPSRPPFTLGRDSARFARMRLALFGRVMLPEVRLWDVVPTFRANPARTGARWTDTIAREANHDGFRQAMRGVRVSTLVGDTVVGGRRLLVVRDSARVRYEERVLEDERTLDTVVTITRTVDGVIRGWYLYDPEIALFRARVDSTVLSGEAVLQYPSTYAGPHTFRTPARYERYRTSDLYNQTAYTERVQAIQAANQRAWGGMVRVPNTDLERRLSNGDTTARDSVLNEWQRSADPDQREKLFSLLKQWEGRDRRFQERVDSLRVAGGDTAYLYSELASKAYSGGRPADTADVRRMLVFMESPALAFAFGQSRDWLYENLRQGLTTLPPAVTRDTSRWSCTPAACRMLADQWRTAREPRLREVGLVALAMLDPARWGDTVLARVTAGSRFLESTALLVRGVGAPWPAASKSPMPSPNADWRVWAEWMNGVDPRYAADRAAMEAAGRLPRRPEPIVRFEDSHASAIRLFQLRIGRDVIGELRRAFEAAPSDSARLVFGTMLQGLGELRLTPAGVAEYFRSSEPARHALARAELMRLFFGRTELADSVTALPLLDRLIALVVEGTPAWRPLNRSSGDWARQGPELHRDPKRQDVFLLGDSIPLALREKWKDRVGVVMADEWARRPLTEAAVLYTLSSVRRVGPFVVVGVTTSERMPRRPGEAPRHYAAGSRYFLMDVNGEWVVVAQDGWVT